MNNVLENSIFSKIGRLALHTKAILFTKNTTNVLDKAANAAAERVVVPKAAPPEVHPVQVIPALELPKGIFPIPPFQKMLQEELANTNKNPNPSFVIQLGLIQKNCNFLTEKAQKVLALDCLKSLQQLNLGNIKLAFSSTGKMWLLLPNLSENNAISTAKIAFQTARQLIREELDLHLPLIELNMYKLGQPMPEVR